MKRTRKFIKEHDLTSARKEGYDIVSKQGLRPEYLPGNQFEALSIWDQFAYDDPLKTGSTIKRIKRKCSCGDRSVVREWDRIYVAPKDFPSTVTFQTIVDTLLQGESKERCNQCCGEKNISLSVSKRKGKRKKKKKKEIRERKKRKKKK